MDAVSLDVKGYLEALGRLAEQKGVPVEELDRLIKESTKRQEDAEATRTPNCRMASVLTNVESMRHLDSCKYCQYQINLLHRFINRGK